MAKATILQCESCGGTCKVISSHDVFTRYKCIQCGHVYELRSDVVIFEDFTFKNYLAALAKQEKDAREQAEREAQVRRTTNNWASLIGILVVLFLVGAGLFSNWASSAYESYQERKAQEWKAQHLEEWKIKNGQGPNAMTVERAKKEREDEIKYLFVNIDSDLTPKDLKIKNLYRNAGYVQTYSKSWYGPWQKECGIPDPHLNEQIPRPITLDQHQ